MSRDIDLLLARDPVLWRHFERIDGVEDGDDQDGDTDREEPRRSEPADFGHGESTGVQEL